jgi:hypothetical protein
MPPRHEPIHVRRSLGQPDRPNHVACMADASNNKPENPNIITQSVASTAYFFGFGFFGFGIFLWFSNSSVWHISLVLALILPFWILRF